MNDRLRTFVVNFVALSIAFVVTTLYFAVLIFLAAVIQPFLAPIREWLGQFGPLPLLLVTLLMFLIMSALIKTILEPAGEL